MILSHPPVRGFRVLGSGLLGWVNHSACFILVSCVGICTVAAVVVVRCLFDPGLGVGYGGRWGDGMGWLVCVDGGSANSFMFSMGVSL